MNDTFSQTLHNWQCFYTMTGEVAGTLIGLMFIAMSVGSGSFRGDKPPAEIERLTTKVRTFISPTLVHLTAVVVIAAILCMPINSPAMLSVCLGTVGALGVGFVGVTLRRLRAHNQQRALDASQWGTHFYLPCLCYGIALGVAVALPFTPAALPVLAASVVLFLVVGIRNSWLATLYASGVHR